MYKIEHADSFKRGMRKVQKRLGLYYPHTLLNFIQDLNYKMQFLETHPEMYQIYEKPNKRRAILKYGYILIYEIRGNTVYISNILHSKQSQNNK